MDFPSLLYIYIYSNVSIVIDAWIHGFPDSGFIFVLHRFPISQVRSTSCKQIFMFFVVAYYVVLVYQSDLLSLLYVTLFCHVIIFLRFKQCFAVLLNNVIAIRTHVLFLNLLYMCCCVIVILYFTALQRTSFAGDAVHLDTGRQVAVLGAVQLSRLKLVDIGVAQLCKLELTGARGAPLHLVSWSWCGAGAFLDSTRRQ